ncbi:hypothetical protein LSAT2_014115 [Lamellibrachia satsuma]|nr:hypothetical protein LSAT2_014115 [Lamellibrachia satsuma]
MCELSTNRNYWRRIGAGDLARRIRADLSGVVWAEERDATAPSDSGIAERPARDSSASHRFLGSLIETRGWQRAIRAEVANRTKTALICKRPKPQSNHHCYLITIIANIDSGMVGNVLMRGSIELTQEPFGKTMPSKRSSNTVQHTD